MEFGTLIPLYFISMCCMFMIPIVGISLLAFIHFQLKDRLLSKSIIITVVSVAGLSFILPFLQLIGGYFRVKACCDASSIFTPDILVEIIFSTIGYGFRLLIPGSAAGFLIAFLIVVPIIMIVRKVPTRVDENTEQKD